MLPRVALSLGLHWAVMGVGASLCGLLPAGQLGGRFPPSRALAAAFLNNSGHSPLQQGWVTWS